MGKTRKGSDERKPKRSKTALYELLKVKSDATAAEIRRAYFKLALATHPDKCIDNPKAAENFQALQQAYGILKDPQKRSRYDTTGCIDDESPSFWSAYEYYRGKKISERDIDEFEKGYKNSQCEEEDLKEYFLANKGVVSRILEYIPCSNDEDIPRFMEFFSSKICEEDLRPYAKAFNHSKKSVLNTEELDAEGEDLMSEDDEDDEQEESEEEEEEEEDSDMDDEEGEEDEEVDENSRINLVADAEEQEEDAVTASDAPPSLLDMIAKRQAKRAEGFAAFEAKWAAREAQESTASKRKRKKVS
ncbi:hypothetical protein CYMTET_34363 [Cymbomonas tetramitiformis]|uniref:J domain-containing protein n=1 Tax=Cymbomonas tetramitiformis TaxID=36881 RepID=A0AAE0KQ94_9CHLO|nr:hypothetical protein CYMTET_34363 [Cymbomonas tetramitiformis]|eukprot:gene3363-4230_t